jgi:hypothetical protein
LKTLKNGPNFGAKRSSKRLPEILIDAAMTTELIGLLDRPRLPGGSSSRMHWVVMLGESCR